MLINYQFEPCQVVHEGIRAALTDPQLIRLEESSRRVCLKTGELVFREGDKTSHTFSVISGVLKLTKAHCNNQSLISGLMFPGNSLFDVFKPRHTSTAEAATDIELCKTPLEAYWRLFGEASELERALFRACISDLEARQDWLLSLRGCSAYRRVASFLLLLAKHAETGAHRMDPVPVRFWLPLSRGEMADFLDLTLETVSRQLSLLKKRRIIECRSKNEVIVSNIALLAAHASGGF